MEPAALLKPSGKNVASVNHFCREKKILREPGVRCGMKDPQGGRYWEDGGSKALS